MVDALYKKIIDNTYPISKIVTFKNMANALVKDNNFIKYSGCGAKKIINKLTIINIPIVSEKQ